MSAEGTTRRAWGQWLRRLGFFSPDATGPPVANEVVQAIIVGDERELRERWAGPRGLAGGRQDGVQTPVIQVVAGVNGCDVDLLLRPDGAVPEQYWIRLLPVSELLAELAPGTQWDHAITWADPSAQGSSRVVSYDTIAAPRTLPLDGLGNVDAFTAAATGTIAPWHREESIWVAPGMLLEVVSEALICWFGVRIREHGDAPRG